MNYTILEHAAQGYDIVLREIFSALEKLGHKVNVIRVVKDNDLIKPIDLQFLLDIHNPDRIVWRTGTGHAFMDVWDKDLYKHIPKISLNYDEPFSRICGTTLEDAWKESGQRDDFFIGIWDGYWRRRCHKKWGMRSFPCHLAVNEWEHVPKPEMQKYNDIVFYGMFQSFNRVIQIYNSLPTELQKLLKSVDGMLTSQALDASNGRSTGIVPCTEELIDIFDLDDVVIHSSGQHQRMLRWAIWALAKNTERIKVLRAVLKKNKVVMYCEQEQLDHAKEAEIEKMLHDVKDNLVICNTSGWSPENLANIPNFGKLHLQITDPQSVEGGIPYRVFQTAACGKALLTDRRQELCEAFIEEKEFFVYRDHTDVNDQLMFCLLSDGNIKDVGAAARERFLKEHTWTHRIAEWEGWIASRQLSLLMRG